MPEYVTTAKITVDVELRFDTADWDEIENKTQARELAVEKLDEVKDRLLDEGFETDLYNVDHRVDQVEVRVARSVLQTAGVEDE